MMPRLREPQIETPLRTARLAAGLTQMKLAIKAGVSIPTVQNMESGKRMSRSTVERLALALGCKPSTLQP
jgi:transcriptional regulator with XRE-family HTH domain